MAEYSNTVKDGITPGGKSNNGAERSAMRGKADAAATSERERAAANSKLVRQQNWSGLTRSRRTNASPTKCSWFHDRLETTASDDSTDRPDDDDDCQRRPTERRRTTAVPCCFSSAGDFHLQLDRSTTMPFVRPVPETGPSLCPPVPRCHRPPTGRNYGALRPFTSDTDDELLPTSTPRGCSNNRANSQVTPLTRASTCHRPGIDLASPLQFRHAWQTDCAMRRSGA
jgi:hypothetical protein